MHHTLRRSEAEIAEWVRIMDRADSETIILSMATGAEFDSIMDLYGNTATGLKCGAGWTIQDMIHPTFLRRHK
jgi:hypothetical protein